MEQFVINPDNATSAITELVLRLKVKDVMSKSIHTAQREQTIDEVRELMKVHSLSALPVVAEGKRLCGIFSLCDLLEALETENGMQETVEQYMSKNVIGLEEDMPVSFAINYMEKYDYGRFPVLNKHKELVGIITNRDIVNHLLFEMNQEMLRLEEMLPKKPHQDPQAAQQGTETSEDLQFLCHRYNFESAGKASTRIKVLLKEKGLERSIIRRIAVASYELEMNLIIHSLGGQLCFFIRSDEVEIVARDRGPGIADLDRALREGFSTAGDWVRSLGFGAGMGLPNVKRVSDEFSIKSETEEAKAPEAPFTEVRVKIFTQK